MRTTASQKNRFKKYEIPFETTIESLWNNGKLLNLASLKHSWNWWKFSTKGKYGFIETPLKILKWSNWSSRILFQNHFFNTAYSGKITFICEYFASGISKICFNRIFFVIIHSAYKICWGNSFNIQSAIEGWKSKQPIFFWKTFHRGKLSHLQNFNRIFNRIPLKFNRIFNRNSLFFQSNFQVWGNSFYWKKPSKFKFQSNFESWNFSIFLLKFFNRGCSGGLFFVVPNLLMVFRVFPFKISPGFTVVIKPCVSLHVSSVCVANLKSLVVSKTQLVPWCGYVIQFSVVVLFRLLVF